MELYQLRTFVAIARSGHLTRAADQLHLTQSALSKQLKGLEEELNVELFERTQLGMKLTGAGRTLLPAALRTLAGAAELQTLAQSMHGRVAGPLRLGTIIDPASIRLGPLLGELLRFYPHIEVRLHHGISGSVLQRLCRKELDACFFLGPMEEPDCVATPLFQERYVLAAPLGWQQEVAWADWPELAALPWVRTPPGSSQHRITAQLFGQHGLVAHAVVEADQEASMLDLVKCGVGLCLMRERYVRDAVERGEVAVSDRIAVDCPLQMVHLRQDTAQPVVQALLASLPKVWAMDYPTAA